MLSYSFSLCRSCFVCCVCFSTMVHRSSRLFWGRFALKYRVTFACVICLALLFCVSAAVFGQGTDLGTIRGTVTDSTGAVIPSASVTITDALTNTARETKTNAQGTHELFALKPATHRLTPTAPRTNNTQTTH